MVVSNIFLDKTVKQKLKDGVEKMDLQFTEKNCRGCHVTLSEFESNEYKTLCIDCYREENEIVSKTKARTFSKNEREEIYSFCIKQTGMGQW